MRETHTNRAAFGSFGELLRAASQDCLPRDRVPDRTGVGGYDTGGVRSLLEEVSRINREHLERTRGARVRKKGGTHIASIEAIYADAARSSLTGRSPRAKKAELYSAYDLPRRSGVHTALVPHPLGGGARSPNADQVNTVAAPRARPLPRRKLEGGRLPG